MRLAVEGIDSVEGAEGSDGCCGIYHVLATPHKTQVGMESSSALPCSV